MLPKKKLILSSHNFHTFAISHGPSSESHLVASLRLQISPGFTGFRWRRNTSFIHGRDIFLKYQLVVTQGRCCLHVIEYRRTATMRLTFSWEHSQIRCCTSLLILNENLSGFYPLTARRHHMWHCSFQISVR